VSTRTLRVLPEAEAEIDASARWYESKRPGLGVEFIAMIDEVFDEVLEAPVWRERSPWRMRVLRRFPYVVLLVVRDESVEIVAVAHGRRRPGYWLTR